MRLIGMVTGGDRGRRQVTVGVVTDGAVTPLAEVTDFYADLPHWLEEARAAGRGAVPLAEVELAPPVPPSARVLCIGLNYRAHAAEGGFRPPEHPTVFGRWTASLSVTGTPVPVPANEPGLDWEGEVAAIVGARLADAGESEAEAGVLGYAVFNDLTARTAQKLTTQWTLGKNADLSGPIGPIVTADEAGSLADGLRLVTRVNGEVMQDGDTRDMIFTVPELLSRISATMTLHPGDVIATGTPEGVGYVRTPPRLLTPGDVVEVEVERLGLLRTPVTDASARSGA
ncbi:fumarylacetoacetate hydrolase family protein [Planobispora siamensis]|uniref:Fumarylacetoacetate hydrolase n=1 Tax=Planobispora siamensis TaxID=936338 RepID=A0A8J3WM81_9ACTN|nr:fumarylacetoacetate hydrolase family protein [Planobispora siamensis]GIH93227.1 fumarylacetoacetate hydrolase [Planobispora siamensis]